MNRIFIDVDGVLADFVSRILTNYNARHGTTYTHAEVTDWAFQDILKPGQRWWEYIDPDFWLSLDPYPWAQEMVSLVRKSGHPHAFLTALPGNTGESPGLPGALGAAVEGRTVWLDRVFANPEDPEPPHHRMIVAARKNLVVVPGDILIEDAPKYILPAREIGVTVLALAQPWNTDVPDRLTPQQILDRLRIL